MKQFVFLYPIPEIMDFEIKNNGSFESVDQFRQRYSKLLNSSIDIRYRQNGFGINYLVFDGSSVSDVIELQDSDRLIEVGLDFKTHTTKQSNGEYPYPNQDHILNQLEGTKVIRVAGFHMWDCVEKLAKRAYERELDTLVDEDLTEFFSGRLMDPDFKIDKYPTYNPRKNRGFMFDMFLEARKNRPWLWQNY